jgi:hypothetical protein
MSDAMPKVRRVGDYAYPVTYEVSLDGVVIGTVRKYERYANIRPRAITWLDWIAYAPDGEKINGPRRIRRYAVADLVKRHEEKEAS